MSLLVDKQINQRILGQPTLASHVPADDFSLASSKIQAASLNMTIGGIYVPGTDPAKPGGAYTPTKEHTLLQGHTAVIRTAEELNLGPHLAGIAFPPATLSLRGLLTTNPGHIDPGYVGPLHITVINMSRVPFPLRAGDRIMRVLFLELAEDPAASFDVRNNRSRQDVISPSLLEQLSVDFLDVEKRSTKIARKAVRNAALIATAIPVLGTVISILASVVTFSFLVKDDVKKLDVRTSIVEERQTNLLDGRIRKIEDGLLKLQQK